MCVDDDSLFIRGDPFAWNTAATLEIDFVPCDNSTNEFICAPQEEIKRWTSGSQMDIVIDAKQVILSNMT